MRIDLPLCNLKTCRSCADGNCTDKMRYTACDYARLKSLENSGLPLSLPCKVGDTLYRIDMEEKIEDLWIEPCVIDNIVLCLNGDVLFKYDAYDGIICHLEHLLSSKLYLDCYRVFLAEEQAQKILLKKKKEHMQYEKK